MNVSPRPAKSRSSAESGILGREPQIKHFGPSQLQEQLCKLRESRGEGGQLPLWRLETRSGGEPKATSETRSQDRCPISTPPKTNGTMGTGILSHKLASHNAGTTGRLGTPKQTGRTDASERTERPETSEDDFEPKGGETPAAKPFHPKGRFAQHKLLFGHPRLPLRTRKVTVREGPKTSVAELFLFATLAKLCRNGDGSSETNIGQYCQ